MAPCPSEHDRHDDKSFPVHPLSYMRRRYWAELLRHSGGLRAEPHLDRKLVAAEALETKSIRHRTIPNTPK